jgi:hypothetical protein
MNAELDLERDINNAFRLACDQLGFEQANALWDKYGLNDDEPNPHKVSLAVSALAEAITLATCVNRLRQPHPRQAEIDAESAALLRATA